jgi:hypothetical protein
MLPRFAQHVQGPAPQSYQCASAIFHSATSAERTVFATLTCQHVVDGALWRATTPALQTAAELLLCRGVIEPIPDLPDAYLLTAFGVQVAGIFSLLCLDADP